MGTHIYIVIGLILYGCVMLAMSSFWMFRVRKAVDYLVAGRNLVDRAATIDSLLKITKALGIRLRDVIDDL